MDRRIQQIVTNRMQNQSSGLQSNSPPIVNQQTAGPRIPAVASFQEIESQSLEQFQIEHGGSILNQRIPMELWRLILFFGNNLQTILMFRLISKPFEKLVYIMQILKEKATLLMDIQDDGSGRERTESDLLRIFEARINFAAKENLNVNYRKNLSVSSLQDISTEFLVILKIILDIKDCSEMELLTKIILSGNFEQIRKVQKLNFYNINDYENYGCENQTYVCNATTQKLLTTIESNIQNFPSLTNLQSGWYVQKHIVNYPRLLSQLIDLCIDFNLEHLKAINLKNLLIGCFRLSKDEVNTVHLENLMSLRINIMLSNVERDFFNNISFPQTSLNLSLSNLKHLEIDKIRDCNTTFSQSLPNLEQLIIGPIEKKSSLRFSSFPKLQHLRLCKLQEGSSIYLNEIPNLKNLEIGYMGKNVTCQLLGSLDNLTHLRLVSNDNTANFKLPALPKLQYLNAHSSNLQRLPSSLPQVNNWKCFIDGKDTTISTSFNSLENLVIPKISENTVLILSGSMPNLKSLTIEKIGKNAKITFSEPLPNLTSLTFGDVASNSIISLSSPMTNIRTLAIGNVDSCAKIILSHTLPSLTSLSFGNIGAKAEINFSKSIPNLTILNFGEVNYFSIIQLPKALNALSKLQINENSCRRLNLPASLPNFTELTILPEFTSCSYTYQRGQEKMGQKKFRFILTDDSKKLDKIYHGYSHALSEISIRLNKPPCPEETDSEICCCQ